MLCVVHTHTYLHIYGYVLPCNSCIESIGEQINNKPSGAGTGRHNTTKQNRTEHAPVSTLKSLVKEARRVEYKPNIYSARMTQFIKMGPALVHTHTHRHAVSRYLTRF